MRAVTIAVGRTDLSAAVRLLETVITAGAVHAKQISFRLPVEYRPDVPLRNSVKTHQNLVGLLVIKDGSRHITESVDEGRVIVIGWNHLDRRFIPEPRRLYKKLLYA